MVGDGESFPSGVRDTEPFLNQWSLCGEGEWQVRVKGAAMEEPKIEFTFSSLNHIPKKSERQLDHQV